MSAEGAACGAATAGETGLGIEAGICWLIAARVSQFLRKVVKRPVEQGREV